jgi:beta-glucosidase
MHELKGFERVTLKPVETKTATFHPGPAELGYWSMNACKWIQEAEAFDIWVGDDSLATLHSDLGVVR